MNWRDAFRSWFVARHFTKRRMIRRSGFDAAEVLETRLVLSATPVVPAWFMNPTATVSIHYDFRASNGVANQITNQEIQAVTPVLQAWTAASGGRFQFVRDTTSAAANIIDIGVGNLSALGLASAEGGPLAASTHALKLISGKPTSVGTIWLDVAEPLYVPPLASNSVGGVSFTAVLAHEIGQILGLKPDFTIPGIMNPDIAVSQDLSGIKTAFQYPSFFVSSDVAVTGFVTANLTPTPQLTIDDITQLLNRASSATASNDAIIAIVDRNGNILGVRQELGVVNAIKDQSTLAFATDGAIAEARTAAFFANGTAPITSRTVEDLSQTTILQREVEANPNLTNTTTSTVYGPGFVAPIGIGGNFPAGVANTPDVDLFDIEATNRDSTLTPGIARFNIDPANIPSGQTLNTPISYGTAVVNAGATTAGSPIAQDKSNRGIGTLPGGIPIYLNGAVVGGIGVFFPGSDGYATHEQGFVHGTVKTVTQEMNSAKDLEAEYIDFAALGGSAMAAANGVSGAVIGNINGFAPVAGTGLPFGFITLNGIALPLFGSTPGTKGLQDLINGFGGHPGANSGTSQIFVKPSLVDGNTTYGKLLSASTVGNVTTYKQITPGAQNIGSVDPLLVIGQSYTTGYLVTPHTSASSSLTVAEMTAIINAGIAAANRVRATLRLNPNGRTGASGVRMTFAITDTEGNVLALYRMADATVFSTDVAVAKARNVAYYDDPTRLQPQDQAFVNGQSGAKIKAGTAFTSRTFRFLAEPFFPSGVNDSIPPQFSILNDAHAAAVNPATGQNIGAPAAASAFTSVLGHDVFNPGTNFHQKKNANQNGIVFFPGSTALYKNGKLVGGLGVSGDGVNQDDVVTFLAAQGFLANGTTIPTADETFVKGVRLPYLKFDRNPFG